MYETYRDFILSDCTLFRIAKIKFHQNQFSATRESRLFLAPLLTSRVALENQRRRRRASSHLAIAGLEPFHPATTLIPLTNFYTVGVVNLGGFFSAYFPENSQIDHPAENGHIFENTSSLGCLILPHCAAWFQPEFEIGLENQKARLQRFRLNSP